MPSDSCVMFTRSTFRHSRGCPDRDELADETQSGLAKPGSRRGREGSGGLQSLDVGCWPRRQEAVHEPSVRQQGPDQVDKGKEVREE